MNFDTVKIATTKKGRRFIQYAASGENIVQIINEKTLAGWDRSKVTKLKRRLDEISDGIHQSGVVDVIKAHDFMFQACQRRIRAIRAEEAQN